MRGRGKGRGRKTRDERRDTSGYEPCALHDPIHWTIQGDVRTSSSNFLESTGGFDAAVVDRLRRMFQVRGPNTDSNTDPDTGSDTDPHSPQALEKE